MIAPLRLGLILDRPIDPPDWCIRLITQISNEPRIALVALIQSASLPLRPDINPIARCLLGLERLLIAQPASACRDSLAQAIADTAVISRPTSETLQPFEFDVLLDLSADRGRSIGPELAHHGVWFPDWLDPGSGLSSLSVNAPVTRISLYRRTTNEGEPIGIAQASLNPKFVASRNALFMCEKAVALILRTLKRTHSIGRPDVVESLRFPTRPSVGVRAISRYLRHLTGGLACRGIDYLRSKTHRRPGMFYLKSGQGSLTDFNPSAGSAHVSRTDSFFADPFLWDHHGETYCFFEEYDYRTGKGHISAGRLEDDELTDVRPVLQTGYHLSFPFLFEHDGELYMLPETSEVKRLEVWKCVAFPDRWERHATAFEGLAASDSTLNLVDGTWWLFTNVSRDPFNDMNTELHVFRVDGPDLERIEPHTFNPVVVDSNRARNAGRILDLGGRHFRPCQDNSHGRYGYGLRVMEIRSLSLDEYDEVETRAITPDFEPGISGCHHLDVRNGRYVIDVRKKVGGYARQR